MPTVLWHPDTTSLLPTQPDQPNAQSRINCFGSVPGTRPEALQRTQLSQPGLICNRQAGVRSREQTYHHVAGGWRRGGCGGLLVRCWRDFKPSRTDRKRANKSDKARSVRVCKGELRFGQADRRSSLAGRSGVAAGTIQLCR